MGAVGTQRSLKRVIARRGHLVVSVALAALAVASLASIVLPKTYRCETRLEAEATPGTEAATRVQSVKETILSSKTFEAVAGDLGLVVAGDTKAERQAAVEARLRATEVLADDTGEGKYRIIVRHDADDPDTCFRVARRIADLYQEDVNETPRKEQLRAVGELRASEGTARAAADAAKKVQDDHLAANADLLEGTEERLAKVREEMRALETIEMDKLKNEVDRLDKLLQEETAMKTVTRKDVDRVRLAQVEKRLADAQAVFAAAADGSPESKAAAAEIAAATEEKKTVEATTRTVEEVVANPLHEEVKAKHLAATSALGIAEIKLRESRKTERDLQARSKQAVPLRARLAELEKATLAARETHEKCRLALEAGEARLALLDRDRGLAFVVAEPPERPDSPAGPGPVLFALGGLVLGAGIGVVTAAALDRADRSFREVDAAAELLGVPALGAIERIVTPADAAADRRARIRHAVGVGFVAAVALVCAGLAIADRSGDVGTAVRSAVAVETTGPAGEGR